MRFFRGLCVSGFVCLSLAPYQAWAVVVNGYDIFATFHFLDARQSNSAGGTAGIRDSFGIDLSPVAGTNVTATQGSVVRNVSFLNSPALPFQFGSSTAFDATRTGAWDLALTNPGVNAGSTVNVLTRPLVSAVPPPFVTDVTLSGGGLTPTIAWQRPAGYTPSSQSIFITDRTHGSTLIYIANNIGATVNAFTIPTGVLANNTQYIFAVQLDERQTTTVPLAGTLVGRSRSYVDFTTLPPNFQGAVALPVVGVDANPNDNLGAPFQFDIAVAAGVPLLIDPVVAAGYEYKIGSGDPLITSVALPDIGDPSFDVYVWNGSQYDFDTVLAPGVRHTFASAVSQFQVLGIDVGLGVDPANPLGFVTELIFAGNGRFTGTQTPITQFIAAVPEPETYAMLISGLGLLGWVIRRKSAKAKPT